MYIDIVFVCLLSFLFFFFFFFFFNDTATTEIYTLSLHDALPGSRRSCRGAGRLARGLPLARRPPVSLLRSTLLTCSSPRGASRRRAGRGRERAQGTGGRSSGLRRRPWSVPPERRSPARGGRARGPRRRRAL